MSKLSIPRRRMRCPHCAADAPYHQVWCQEVRPKWSTPAQRAQQRWRMRAVLLIALASTVLLVWFERGPA